MFVNAHELLNIQSSDFSLAAYIEDGWRQYALSSNKPDPNSRHSAKSYICADSVKHDRFTRFPVSEKAADVIWPVIARWPRVREYILPLADEDDHDLFEEHKVLDDSRNNVICSPLFSQRIRCFRRLITAYAVGVFLPSSVRQGCQKSVNCSRCCGFLSAYAGGLGQQDLNFIYR